MIQTETQVVMDEFLFEAEISILLFYLIVILLNTKPVAQRCGVSILGITQNETGHGPGPAAPTDPARQHPWVLPV